MVCIRMLLVFASLISAAYAAHESKGKSYPPAVLGKVYEGDPAIDVRLSQEGEVHLFVDGYEVKIGEKKESEPGHLTLTLGRKAPLKEGEAITIRTGKGPLSAAVTVEKRPAVEPPKPSASMAGIDPVTKGDQFLTGRMAAGRSVRIEVENLKGKRPGLAVSATSNQHGEFAVRLNAKLGCDDTVLAFDNLNTLLNARTVNCPVPAPPDIYEATEGQTSVSGNASGAEKVEVRILAGGKLVAHKSGAVDADTGDWSVTLPSKLTSGEEVTVSSLAAGKASAPAKENVEIVGYDWGRVRAYFVGGVILARNNQSFSQQDPFVGFNLDKSWLQTQRGGIWDRVRLNTFFDTRLASIAVQKPATDATVKSSIRAGGLRAAAETAAADTTGDFVKSEKVGVMQAGLYIPVSLKQWTFRKEYNSLFLAPLAKVGFATGVESSTESSQENFFPFHGFGARLGHFREYKETRSDGKTVPSDSVAPELISYLDVVFGPYKNFASADPQMHLREQLRRASFEGVLKIPYTPLIVGFNANIGVQRKKGFAPAADDLRFLFGTRFDVGKLFGKLLSF